MSEIPQEVRDLAAGIASDIETHGHYQGVGPMYSYGLDGPCCIIQSPTAFGMGGTEELAKLIGVDDLLTWNDTTPTDDVLAMLRKIAAGERP